MDNAANELRELRASLIQRAIETIGEEHCLSCHNLPDLWRAHGDTILTIVNGAKLTNAQLAALNDTVTLDALVSSLPSYKSQKLNLAAFRAATMIGAALLVHVARKQQDNGSFSSSVPLPPGTRPAPISRETVPAPPVTEDK